MKNGALPLPPQARPDSTARAHIPLHVASLPQAAGAQAVVTARAIP